MYKDVGAFDPIKVSVTKAFYLRGWHGINIEPHPCKIDLFNQDRPNDINLPIGVGQQPKNVTFFVNDQLLTVLQEYSRCVNNTINLTIDTMSNTRKKYVPKGTEIDFCKIDVEGSERDVLLGYDFKNYRPKMFCIESTKPMSYIPTHQTWEKILIENGYTFVYKKQVNRYYVDNHFPELLVRGKIIIDILMKTPIRKYHIE